MHRPLSGVGTYEYTPAEQKDLRQHVDDPVDLYGGHGFKSANFETPVYTVPKAKAARLRANLTKGTQGFVPGYSLSDPMYMEYPDQYFFLPPAQPASFGAAAPHNFVASECDEGGSQDQGKGVGVGVGVGVGSSQGTSLLGAPLLGTVGTGGTPPGQRLNVPANAMLGIPRHSGIVRSGSSGTSGTLGSSGSSGSSQCQTSVGVSDPYAAATPSEHLRMPMALPSPGLAFSPEARNATNWLGYGCDNPPPRGLSAAEPQLTAQGDFHPFDVPMAAAVPVKSPYLKTGTYLGATLEIPQASYMAFPYKRPLTVTGPSGWPVSAMDAMRSPTVRY